MMTCRFPGSSGIIFVSLLFLFLDGLHDLHAQKPAIRPSGFPVSIDSNHASLANTVEGTLQVIAVMAEFQPDENRFTSGNGTFGPGSIPYLENPGTNIDALPHNREYFESHLEFAKNYFEKMSNGMLIINYHVLPDVITLPQKMQEYSPIGENPDLNPLAYLARDAWNQVMEKGALPVSINPNENTAFIIFHAGVGRDIQLTGTTLDRTPQDIPSVYLSRQAFRNLLSDPSFSGFEIDNGNLLVDNTLILPRTLTRSGEDITGSRFILPLSINGMVTAQIGSHLGLPDLFNTETGESGIGRFGLMDGAGIFAYNGLFPPELSAWERIHLGWADPFIVSYDEALIELSAISMNGRKEIAKVELSSDEYFLIENRHRDFDGDGVTFTIRRPDGSYTRQTFTNSDTEFTNQSPGFERLVEPGVVVDVSNYDFALPGGLVDNNETERLLNGGILIWHIDESVIRQKLGRTGINSNPERRAVNLKEADGAQDIGRPVTIGLFQNEINGSAFDFWWSGNNATVISPTGEITLYQNRFGTDTLPDNSSNSGAVSYFEIYEFSDNLPVASFRIRPINPFSDLYRITHSRNDLSLTSYTDGSDEYYKRYPLAIQPYLAKSGNWILIPATNGIYLYDYVSNSLSEIYQTDFDIQQPFISSQDGFFTLSEKPDSELNQITVYGYELLTDQINTLWNFTITAPNGFVSSHISNLLDIDGTNLQFDLLQLNSVNLQEPSWFSDKINGYQSRIVGNNFYLQYPGGLKTHPLSQDHLSGRLHTGIIRQGNDEITFFLLSDRSLYLFSSDSEYREATIVSENHYIDWPAFADLNGDGSPDVLFVDLDANLLIAKNKNGAMLSGFPVSPPPEVNFIGTPIIADLNGDGYYEILITGQDPFSMNIYAYNPSGMAIDGFPLYTGSVSEKTNQPVHPLFLDGYLIAISHHGDLKVWEFPNSSVTAWKSRYGNQTNNKISADLLTGVPELPSFTLLNTEETYNWPNPASNETYIRFETDSPADIRIRITTISGRIIYDQSMQSRGGLPEEIRLDTSTWASGGYYALIEAQANSRTERKIVKIAIVK